MICENVIGNLTYEEVAARFAGYEVDPVDFDWHEAFGKLHRKESHGGRTIGVRLGDWVLSHGLREGDVLGVDEEGAAILVVHILPCRAVVADVAPDHPSSLARVAYEVGNTHAALFFGESDFQLVTPYTEPLLTALGAIHGVTAHAEDVTFDLGRSLSTTAHHHHH